MSRLDYVTRLWVSLCSLWVLGVVSLEVKAKEWQPSNMVIIISMDGMRHDYPDKGDFPGLKRMQDEGLRVEKMIPTFPSNTFPGHVSLATGTTPEHHGIIDNSFYDKKRRKYFDKYTAAQWLEAEPLWASFERQGKKAATYYWLGSEGPWRGTAASYFKAPFTFSFSEQKKVEQIIEWMDLPLDDRPQLIMSYWHGADSEGHLLGPDNILVSKKIGIQDYFLQSLQKAIDERNAWSSVTLILVSDHGMTENGQPIYVNDLFKEGGFEAYFKISSSVAHINFKKEFRSVNAKNSIFEFFKKQKGFDVFYPHNMPKDISVNHASRSGDLVLVANSKFYFSSQGVFKKNLPRVVKGGRHGLSPKHPDMAVIFLAQGRGIKRGSTLKEVQMIDVAPSISKLMGIEPPLQSQGLAFLPNK